MGREDASPRGRPCAHLLLLISAPPRTASPPRLLGRQLAKGFLASGGSGDFALLSGDGSARGWLSDNFSPKEGCSCNGEVGGRLVRVSVFTFSLRSRNLYQMHPVLPWTCLFSYQWCGYIRYRQVTEKKTSFCACSLISAAMRFFPWEQKCLSGIFYITPEPCPVYPQLWFLSLDVAAT